MLRYNSFYCHSLQESPILEWMVRKNYDISNSKISLHARHHCRHFTYIISLNSLNNPKKQVVIIPLILLMREVRHKEVGSYYTKGTPMLRGKVGTESLFCCNFSQRHPITPPALFPMLCYHHSHPQNFWQLNRYVFLLKFDLIHNYL